MSPVGAEPGGAPPPASEAAAAPAPAPAPASELNSANLSTRERDAGVFFYDTERAAARDSVNGMPAHAAADAGHDPFSFFHFDNDRDIHVFDEPPTVRVLGGRFEDAWPTRYVEYDVEVRWLQWLIPYERSLIDANTSRGYRLPPAATVQELHVAGGDPQVVHLVALAVHQIAPAPPASTVHRVGADSDVSECSRVFRRI